MKKSENEGGFISHLVELRERLIHSIIFLFVKFFLSHLFNVLRHPLINISPPPLSEKYFGEKFIKPE